MIELVSYKNCKSLGWNLLGNEILWTQCDHKLMMKTLPDGTTTCTKNWGTGYYGFYEIQENPYYGFKDVRICKNCDSSCTDWVDAEINSCVSCPSGYYLNVLTGGHIGRWLAKSSGTTTINLFVTPGTESTGADGSYSKPFGHIVKALKYANQEAAPYTSATVFIYLLNGEHVMSRNTNAFNFEMTAKDATSLQQSITIQPAFWGQTVGGHTFVSGDADCIESGSKLTVVYQMGNDFTFEIPNELNINNIIFDALDSSILSTRECLLKGARCCDSNDTDIFIHSQNSISSTSWNYSTNQTEFCLTTQGFSLFQFKVAVITEGAQTRYQVWVFECSYNL